MSRIYETLKNIENGGPGSLVPAIDGDELTLSEQALTAVRGRSTPPPVLVLSNREQPVVPAPSAVEPVPELTPHAAGELASVRMLPLKLAPGSPLFPFDGTDSRVAEQYRVLRTNLLQHDAQPRVVAVTSGGPADGKTVTAINLAGALSLKSGVKVLLIDADMRRTSIAERLGIPNSPGLAEVLKKECQLYDALVRVDLLPNLYLLPAGGLVENPTELLDSAEWKSLIRSAREEFRMTVVDTTPVGTVADFNLVHTVADGVLLVVRPEHTRRNVLEHAVAVIGKSKMLGAVVNCMKDWVLLGRDDSPYYYSSRRADGQAAAAKGDKKAAAAN